MLSPEEAQALVEQHGGIRPAARAVPAHYHTFRYWLNPEPHKARQRKHYHSLSGLAYSRRLLQKRRQLALTRIKQREQRRRKEA